MYWTAMTCESIIIISIIVIIIIIIIIVIITITIMIKSDNMILSILVLFVCFFDWIECPPTRDVTICDSNNYL